MAAVDPAGNYATTFYITPDTAEHTVYTVPANVRGGGVLVTQIRCTDDGGVARTVILIARKGGTDYTLDFNVAIPANAAYNAEFMPLVLLETESIKATSSASGVHIMVSVAQQSRKS